MKSIDWTEWNPSKPPATGTVILAILKFYDTQQEIYALLRTVDEDDIMFRAYDDNSEFNEMALEMVRYKVLDEIN